MSRVIKFRAWDSFTGKMLHNNEPLLWNRIMPAISVQDGPEYQSYTVMQFTGLTDCNGVEIYEGDIVTATCVDQDSCCGATYEYTFCVQWRHHRWYFDDGKDNKRVLGQYPPLKHCSFESCCRNGDELKVIGNIYEHPHLLEAGS